MIDRACGNFARSRLLDALEEFRDGKRQRGGELLDVDEGEVPRAALDVAEVGSVDLGLLGEFLLGQLKLFAPRLDGEAEPLVV